MYDWSNNTERMYRQMTIRHQELWEFVRRYITSNDIHTVLEIGCGMYPPARDWVDDWTGVDLHPDTPAIHEDFFDMDVTPWKGVDLLLACGVIEHCEQGCEAFLAKAKEVEAGHILISFFRGLHHPKQIVRQSRHGYFNNRYNEKYVRKVIGALGFTGEIVRLNMRNTILLLEAAHA